MKITRFRHCPKDCFSASAQYRQLQIFVVLANICFRECILPNIQFLGAVLLIAFLYSVLILGTHYRFWTIFLLSLNFLVVLTIVWTLIGMGSQPILKSSKLLKNWKFYNQNCKCRWSKRFLRSCPKVVLQMGSFHALDRSRAPSLMRFVLQRTFFLVKSTGNINGIFVSIPA